MILPQKKRALLSVGFRGCFFNKLGVSFNWLKQEVFGSRRYHTLRDGCITYIGVGSNFIRIAAVFNFGGFCVAQ